MNYPPTPSKVDSLGSIQSLFDSKSRFISMSDISLTAKQLILLSRQFDMVSKVRSVYETVSRQAGT